MTESERKPEAFVIGPIGDEGAEYGTEGRLVYEKALEVLDKVIEPACRAIGIRSIRADDIATPGEITDQVIRKLRDSDVVIADLTDANPNVMYELGLRHSIAGVTIPIAERREEGLPFDINVIRTVIFKRTDQGLIDARKKLEAMLRSAVEDGEWDHVTATRIWLQDEASKGEASESTASVEEEEAEPPGVVDLLFEMEEAQPRMNEAIAELGSVIEEFGTASQDATERTSKSDQSGRGFAGRMAILTEYTRSIDPLVVRADTLSRTIEAEATAVGPGIELILAQFEDGTEDPTSENAISLLTTLAGWGAVSPEVQTQTLQDSLSGIEDLSRIVRPKIRLFRSSLDRVLSVFERVRHFGDWAGRILAAIEGEEAVDQMRDESEEE